MDHRKKLLFYCQHSLGMGHLVRSFALAEQISADFEVTLLNGGRLPDEFPIPRSITTINLPPLGFDQANQLVSLNESLTVEEAQAQREKLIRETYGELEPAAIVIELFPFGRKKFRNELLPLLELAKGKSKVICSLRDILVGQRRDQSRHDERAAEIVNRYFDAVLVHSDMNFCRLGETFRPQTPLKVPVVYTGFVTSKNPVDLTSPKKQNVIVSAGGGMVGEKLLNTALEAVDHLPPGYKMKLITGAFLPEDEALQLTELAAEKNGVEVVRFVQNLAQEMSESDVSVSQCGYNTAMDILRSQVSSVVVPFGDNGDDEQMKRARNLERLEAVRVLENGRMTPQTLAAEIIKAAAQTQPKNSLSLEGGSISAQVITDLVDGNSWLKPVRKALENRKTPLRVFFRDDDGGWKNENLYRLIDLVNEFKLSLDIAVIPSELDESFGTALRTLVNRDPQRFSVHQHGFNHSNHELTGRKCEFGESRNRTQQFTDIAVGKRRLQDFFGGAAARVFTPPWNRCTAETAKLLRELGFTVLSREHKAAPFGVDGLAEIPVTLDWFAKRKGIPLSPKEIARSLASQINEQSSIGIMLHHAAMDDYEFFKLRALFALLSESENVHPCLISDLALKKSLSATHIR